METTPTLQNDDIKKQFRTLYLQDKPVNEILEILGIPEGTYTSAYYRNTHNMRDFVNECKKELFLARTELVSRKILTLDTTKSDKRLAIQQKEAEFIRETLGREIYSKRIETIGFNVNKNEPLDEDQKAKIDKLIKPLHSSTSKASNIKNVEFTEVDNTPETA